jgi:hypothetical protein
MLNIREECAAMIAEMIYFRQTEVFANILQGNWYQSDKVAAQLVDSLLCREEPETGNLHIRLGVHLEPQDFRLLAKQLRQDRGIFL